MKTIIFVPTKGPHRFRFGPTQWHDWKVQCRKAAELQEELSDAVVYIPSAVHILGFSYEYEYYRQEMLDNDLTDNEQIDGPAFILERRGQETIEQCELALALAKREDAKLVVLSTPTHFLRLFYLCIGKGVTHKIAWGIPNIREAVTDTLLAIAFPLIDLLGRREWFKKKVIHRREDGKH